MTEERRNQCDDAGSTETRPRHPEDYTPGSPLTPLEQAFAAFVNAGHSPDPGEVDEYCARFPALSPDLKKRIEKFFRIVRKTETRPHYEHPDRIGPYKILEVIGEGGMGTVYLAEQEEPVHRRVALKIIRGGLDSDTALRRFQSEQSALALMSHANIASVYDAGVSRSGFPYFSMEYVPGTDIASFCDTHRLTIRDRVDLFLVVCTAVRHAHQKGIVHRDLKPSNILVTVEYNGNPLPKIIDFGIAKATTQQLTEKTLLTRSWQLVGTPYYMSPEQLRGGGMDIDTRADIYALGIILYRLLAGVPPFDRSLFGSGNLAEILRVIQEDTPPRPSTRIRALPPSSRILAVRRESLVSLQRSLRGDLDSIVLKCLEKEREERYQSVSDLMLDLQAFLAFRPISARNAGALSRFVKFTRRNRQRVAISSAFLALVIFSALAVSSISSENRERIQKLLGLAKQRERDSRSSREFLENQVEILREENKELKVRRSELLARQSELLARSRELEKTSRSNAAALEKRRIEIRQLLATARKLREDVASSGLREEQLLNQVASSESRREELALARETLQERAEEVRALRELLHWFWELREARALRSSFPELFREPSSRARVQSWLVDAEELVESLPGYRTRLNDLVIEGDADPRRVGVLRDLVKLLVLLETQQESASRLFESKE